MGWKYTGDGGWLPGIPARDLTDAEMAEAKRISPGVDTCGLYVREADPPRAKAKGEEGSN